MDRKSARNQQNSERKNTSFALVLFDHILFEHKIKSSWKDTEIQKWEIGNNCQDMDSHNVKYISAS